MVSSSIFKTNGYGFVFDCVFCGVLGISDFRVVFGKCPGPRGESTGSGVAQSGL